MAEKSKGKVALRIIAWLLYLLVLVIGCLPIYMNYMFGRVAPEALVGQVFTVSSGTPLTYYVNFFIYTCVPALIIWGVTLFLWPHLQRNWQFAGKQLIRYIVIALICIGSLAYSESYTGIGRFLIARMQSDDFIEKNYVDTKAVQLKFPEKKHNLIYIWSESMEASYQDEANGGCMPENVIPELTELAAKNYSFSNNDKHGGFYPVTTATYTLGSQVAQMGGIPYITPFHQPNDTPLGDFLPGMRNLGDILADNGYKNVFFSGASSKFARQGNLFKEHGNYEVDDYFWMINQGKIPKDYFVFWGIEDQKIFSFAKDKLNELAKGDQPFNMQLELMDTHAPEGYPTAGYTSDKYGDPYANVLAGASKMITEFVDWVQAQPFGKDTTIIIVGDHFTMAPNYHELHYVHPENASVYNVIINPNLPKEILDKAKYKNRKAVTMDMFPTTLAALGVEIPGNRLALGTNLFSDLPTLAEQKGVETLSESFKRRSDFYEKNFLDPNWLIEPTKAPETQAAA